MWRRLLDFALAALALVLLSPILSVLSFAVWISSGRPILYRGRRVGQGGREFRQYKFRTMVPGAESLGPAITGAGDRRVTRIGAWLRRTKLDELPQLVNVVKGDMSLVGPRPEDPRLVSRYTPEQRKVLSVRPGITGAAALEYVDEETRLSDADWEDQYVRVIMPEKLRIELEYLRSRSFFSDFAILARTARRFLVGVPRGHVTSRSSGKGG